MTDRAASRDELAERITAQHSQAIKRRRLTVGLIVVLGVLACAVALVWSQLTSTAETPDEVEVPNHANENFGFTLTPELLGTDTPSSVAVSVYEDFLCDSCKTLHEQSGAMLHEQVKAGVITLTYHPFTFLLTQSTDEYAQRAANAAVCVADAAGVIAYANMHDLLMTHQPAIGGPGLSDDELLAFAQQAGNVDVSDCVNNRQFDAWVETATRAGMSAQVAETPTVRVDGRNVVRSVNGVTSMPGPDELRYAIGVSE